MKYAETSKSRIRELTLTELNHVIGGCQTVTHYGSTSGGSGPPKSFESTEFISCNGADPTCHFYGDANGDDFEDTGWGDYEGGGGEEYVGPGSDIPSYQKNYIVDALIDDGVNLNAAITLVDSVKFISGLDDRANAITRTSFSNPDVQAITQGNLVYVKPEHFVAFSTFQVKAAYEEVFHAYQFATLGAVLFYHAYGVSSAVGFLTFQGAYAGNLLEQQAKAFANKLQGNTGLGGCT